MRSIRSRAPAASSAAVRRTMQSVRRDDTTAEVALRSALFRKGLRFRKNHRPVGALRIAADIVFSRERVCVFVDGCFWHGCPKHFTPPKSNTLWWIEKITDNQVRDRKQTTQLEACGWRVIRVWEHQLVGSEVSSWATKITRSVCARRRLTAR